MAITIEAKRQATTIAIETFQLVGMAPILRAAAAAHGGVA